MSKLSCLAVLSLLLTYSAAVLAGGPINLGGASGNTPVTYSDPNISIDVESGDFGALSNTQATTLAQRALNLWNNVNNSTVNLTFDTTSLNLDVNNSNYTNYIQSNTGASPLPPDLLNPLIFDSDGSIVNSFFGNQLGTILGFAGSSIRFGASNFEEGFIVINGTNVGYSDSDYVLLFAHEIAHFFGLDHSQASITNTESGPGSASLFCSTSSSSDYPVMYPIACRTSESLHSDDVSAISALYPDTDINDDFGILEGRLTTSDGVALLGANIWAENMTTGEVYSVVSDYLRQRTGYYRLYLPAGNYLLHANSINPEFTSGSGVGPYSADISDASFVAPHPITAITYQGLTPGSDEIITISTNQTTEVNFSSLEASATPPQNEGDDSNIFGAISLPGLLLLLAGLLVRRFKNLYK